MTSSTRDYSAYVAQLASLSGSVVLSFGTAYLMAPDERGRLAVFMLFASLGSYILGLGLPSQALQFGARGNHPSAQTLFVRQVPLSGASAIVLLAICILLEPFDFISPLGYALGCLSAFLGSISNTLSWYEYGTGRYAPTTFLRGAIPFLAFLALAPFISNRTAGATELSALYILLQGAAILFVFNRQRGFWSLGVIIPTSSWSIRKGLRQSSGFFGLQSLTLTQSRIPVIGAAAYFGGVEAAVLSIAVSLGELQGTLTQMRSAITFSEASKQKLPVFNIHFLRAALVTLLPGTITVVAGAFAANAVLPTEYDNLTIYVICLSPGIAVAALMGAALNVLTVRNEYRFASLVLGISVALQLVVFAAGSALGLASCLALWSLLVAVSALAVMIRAARTPPESDSDSNRLGSPDGD